MTSISVLRASQLSDSDVARWNEILASNPCLDSPYFRPEFTLAVAKVRNDVEIAVLRYGGEIRGFFPFQRGRFNVGSPIGGRLSDFHGPITENGLSLPFQEVVERCGLRTFPFDHLLVEEPSRLPAHSQVCGSPYLALPNGFDAYLSTQKYYSKHIGQYVRKKNKIERENGVLVTNFDSRSQGDFNQLFDWKVDQYQRTGAFNPFRFQWPTDLLKEIWSMRTESFRGVLSTVHIGKELLGAHFGMISHGVLHYWFPAYNPDYHKYSPGNLMLLEIAEKGSRQGVAKIDLGKGTEPYKLCFGSAQTLVAEGCVRTPTLGNLVADRCLAMKDWVKSSPLKSPALAAAGMVRPIREWFAFH